MMREERPDPVNAEATREQPDAEIPRGVRLTILFLRVILGLTILALVLALFSCLASLLMAAKTGVNFLHALIQSLIGLGVFVALFCMASAADWMSQFLRARYLPPEMLTSGPPRHPAVLIGVPTLQVVWLYSICDVLVWAVVKIGNLAVTT